MKKQKKQTTPAPTPSKQETAPTPRRQNRRSDWVREVAALGMLTAVTLIMGFTPIGYIPVGPLKLTFMTIPVIIAAALFGPRGGAVIGGMFGLTSFIQAATGASLLTGALFQLQPVLTFLLCVVPRVLEGWLSGLLFKGLSAVRKKPAFSYITGGASVGFLAGTALFVQDKIHQQYQDDAVLAFFFIALVLTLFGIAAGGVLYGLRRAKENELFVYAAAALSVPLLNTLLFMSALFAELKIIAAQNADVSGLGADFAKTFVGVSDKAAGDVFVFFVSMVGAQAVIEAVVCFVIGTAVTKALAVALRRVGKNKTAGAHR